MQPLGKEPEPSRFLKQHPRGVGWKELSILRQRKEIRGGALPAPIACLPPPPLPDPGLAPRPFVLEVGRCWVAGSPGKRSSCAALKGRGSCLNPTPAPAPGFSRRVLQTPLHLPSRPDAAFQTRAAPSPAPRPAASVRPPPLPALRHLQGLWVEREQRQERGAGEATSPLWPGEPPGKLLGPDSPDQPPRKGLPAPPPCRCGVQPGVHNPARPDPESSAGDKGAARLGPAGGDMQSNAPFFLPSTRWRRPASPPPGATRGLPRLHLESSSSCARFMSHWAGGRGVQRGDRAAGEGEELRREREWRGRRTRPR